MRPDQVRARVAAELAHQIVHFRDRSLRVRHHHDRVLVERRAVGRELRERAVRLELAGLQVVRHGPGHRQRANPSGAQAPQNQSEQAGHEHATRADQNRRLAVQDRLERGRGRHHQDPLHPCRVDHRTLGAEPVGIALQNRLAGLARPAPPADVDERLALALRPVVDLHVHPTAGSVDHPRQRVADERRHVHPADQRAAALAQSRRVSALAKHGQVADEIGAPLGAAARDEDARAGGLTAPHGPLGGLATLGVGRRVPAGSRSVGFRGLEQAGHVQLGPVARARDGELRISGRPNRSGVGGKLAPRHALDVAEAHRARELVRQIARRQVVAEPSLRDRAVGDDRPARAAQAVRVAPQPALRLDLDALGEHLEPRRVCSARLFPHPPGAHDGAADSQHEHGPHRQQ